MTNIPKNAIELNEDELSQVNGGAGSASKYYTVQKGDTLYRIANHFGTTIARLKDLNPILIDADSVLPGTRIRFK